MPRDRGSRSGIVQGGRGPRSRDTVMSAVAIARISDETVAAMLAHCGFFAMSARQEETQFRLCDWLETTR
jgi:hypothetical protein